MSTAQTPATTTSRLDGGLATELQRAGMTVRAPWWTTGALLAEGKRRVLRGIHEGFLTSGAQVLTANTFRCNLRALRQMGLQDAGLGWMVHAAVGVASAARNTVGDPTVQLAGSMAPVEDCYRPDLVPTDEELRTEHRWLATELMRAKVDLVLIETMNSEREARVALAEVLAAGGRAWVSFVCDDGARLLSGEPLSRVARAVESDGASAVLVNCTPPEQTAQCLRVLRDVCSGPIGAYPNIEDRAGVPRRTHIDGGLPSTLDPAGFAALTERWRREYGPVMLGGCCGVSPAHLAAAASLTGGRPT